MFLAKTLAVLQQAAKSTFDSDYPLPEFRKVHVGLDFPVESSYFPAVWIDFTPTAPTQKAGINHEEWELSESGEKMRLVTRWLFAGNLTMTAIAFSSLERYRLVDEIIRVFAFGKEESATNDFQQSIRNNDLIAMTLTTDSVDLSGFSATQGTPWGSLEYLYEGSCTVPLIGEYVSDPLTGELAILSRVDVYPYTEPPGDPFEGQEHGEEGWG